MNRADRAGFGELLNQVYVQALSLEGSYVARMRGTTRQFDSAGRFEERAIDSVAHHAGPHSVSRRPTTTQLVPPHDRPCPSCKPILRGNKSPTRSEPLLGCPPVVS